MIRPDIEGLKALAEKAAHQSWAAFTDDSGPRPHTNLVSLSPVTDCAVSIPGVHKRDPNIAFIGAANPAQVLALIARIRHLEAEREKDREALRFYAEQSRLARLIHSEGDAGRHAISEDGGRIARARLEDTHE